MGPPAIDPTSATIDITGDGYRGQDGHQGAHGHGAGGHASDGGDAARGGDGADIHLRLATAGQLISYHSHLRSADIDAANFGNIKLRSHGGNGGDGGAGGNGAKGHKGSRGRDATQGSRGTDGGRGGPGGAAGSGGHGGNGGNGGAIIVEVAPKDAFLQLVVGGLDEPVGWCKGGGGGARGGAGSAGAGGDGGDGGSAYHWETVHWDPRKVHHPAEHDAEGKQTRAAYTETVMDKRIEHHTTPGGKTGPRGPGGSGASDGHGGAGGRDGRVSIMMNGWEYQRRYELAIANFDVVGLGSIATPSAANDEIFEFGEDCQVASVKLRNKDGWGRTASPAHQRTWVRVQENRWLTKAQGGAIFLTESVRAGTTSAPVDGVLPFRLAYDPRSDFRPAGTTTEFAARDLGYRNAAFGYDPIVEEVQVRTIPTQLGIEDETGSGARTRFQREFVNGHRLSSITAQFPIRDTGGLSGLKSLANKEATHITLEVLNISAKDLGRASWSGRAVKVMLWANQPTGAGARTDTVIMPQMLNFTSTHDKAEHELAYPGFHCELPKVPKSKVLFGTHTTPFDGIFELQEALSCTCSARGYSNLPCDTTPSARHA